MVGLASVVGVHITCYLPVGRSRARPASRLSSKLYARARALVKSHLREYNPLAMAVRLITVVFFCAALSAACGSSSSPAKTATVAPTTIATSTRVPPTITPAPTLTPAVVQEPPAQIAVPIIATSIPLPPTDSPPSVESCVTARVPPWICDNPDAVDRCELDVASAGWADLCHSAISTFDTCMRELLPAGRNFLCNTFGGDPLGRPNCRLALFGSRWERLCDGNVSARLVCVENVGRWAFLCFP